MADKRINALTTTSASVGDDYFAIDGATNGTRALSAFSPTFGGNATVTGTLAVNGTGTSEFGGLVRITAGGFRSYGSMTLGATYAGMGGGFQTSYDTPTTRIFYGDGTGFDLRFATRASSTTTDRFTFSDTGKLTISGTDASTTTSSGALVVSGGVGVAGNTVVGGASFTTGDGSGGPYLASSSVIDHSSGMARFYGRGANTSTRATLGFYSTYSDGTGGITLQTFDTSGKATFSSSIGVGGSSNAAVGVYVINTALTGVDQYGVASEPIWTSAAVSGHTIWARTKTAASAFTLTNGTAIYVEQPTLGSGSSITNNYGLRITNQGAAGVANAYGVDILAQSGASSTNVGLRNAGTTLLTNSTASTTTSSGALVVSGGVGVAKNASIGVNNSTGVLRICDNSFGGDYVVLTTAGTDGTGTYGLFISQSSGSGLNATTGQMASLRVNNASIVSANSAGPILQLTGTAPTLTGNASLTFEFTSNTSLTLKMRGNDGVTRSASITFS